MKELIEKINNGDRLNDSELNRAIDHYTTLCSALGWHGEVHKLAYNDALGKLRVLREYRAQRSKK